MEPFQILCGIAVVILTLYYFFTSTFDFWKSRGVPGPRPIPGFGTIKDVILGKMAMYNYLRMLYNDYKNESLIGIFDMRTPILIVKDPDLIKDILIRDFPVFSDRGYTVHEKTEPLSQHLFSLELKRWQPIRTKLTPIFTSHKLKGMFALISECSDYLVDYMEQLVNENEPIECHDVMAKYTTDCFGNCMFGIKMNTMSNKENEFRRIGKKIFHQSWSVFLRNKIKTYSPWFYDILGHILPQDEITNFFIHLIRETMDYREKNNITRNDFIDSLCEIKKQSDTMDINVTDSLLASQAYGSFTGGFETSSTAMCNTLYELALNQKIQNRLREEIDQQYTKYDGNLTYENIKEMKYIDKVFKEVLRKYPVTSMFMRKLSSNYTFNKVKVSIPAGQMIYIPFYAINRDPDIYPEPDVFDPERFNEEAMRNRHPMVYLPFGEGKKICIGLRFAIYQSKLGLIKILRNYKVLPCEKTQTNYAFNEGPIFMTPKNGIYLKIIKINRD